MYFQLTERTDYERPDELAEMRETVSPFNERMIVRSVAEGYPMWGGSYFVDPKKGFRHCLYFANRRVFSGSGRLVDLEIIPGGKILKCIQSESVPKSGTYDTREIFDPRYTLLNQVYRSEEVNSFLDILAVSQTPRITIYTQYYCDIECISLEQWTDLKKRASEINEIRNGGSKHLNGLGVRVSTSLTFPFAEWFQPHHQVKVVHPTLGKTKLPGYFLEVLSVEETKDGIICGAMTNDHVFTRCVFTQH